MPLTEVLALVVVVLMLVLVLVGWYLSYTAARLHRLHTRVEGALAALDAQLVRRAEASVELANSGALDPATSLILAGAASDSLGGAADTLTLLDWSEGDLADREAIESDLTLAIATSLSFLGQGTQGRGTERGDPALGDDLVGRLLDAHQRVHLARRFYNDAVVDVARLRRSGVVRGFRLAGHAQLPRTVEFDDDLATSVR